MATLIFGVVGLLASQHLARLIGFSIIVSSGILLAAIGSGIQSLTAPALFYMVASMFGTSAFFLLTGMAERTRTTQSAAESDLAPLPAVSYQAFGTEETEPGARDEEVGIAIPAAMAFLGLAFVFCVLLVTGLPPLSGFIGKFALLSTLVDARADGSMSGTAWLMIVAILSSGLAGLVALTRIGVRLFWTITGRTTPRLRFSEATPVAFLLILAISMTVWAGPVMTYLQSAAQTLHDPQMYIEAVFSEDTAMTAKAQP
jgi:multicomponent K+:H+ antiporter subunit D